MIDGALLAQLLPAAISAGSALFGKSKKATNERVPNYSNDQITDMNQLRQLGMAGLQDPGAGFEPIANQAISRFNTDTVPSLMERFRSMGANRYSSGVQGALSRAGSDLQGNLASQQAQYGINNRNSLAGLAGLGLRPQFDNIHTPSQPGAMQSLGANAFGPSIKSLLKFISANPEIFNLEPETQPKAQSGAGNPNTDNRNWEGTGNQSPFDFHRGLIDLGGL